MKRTFIVVSLCLVTGFSFAQKIAVKDAKTALSKNSFSEARDLIKPALTNPETAMDAETWKVAGDIEFKVADTEIDKEKLKAFAPNGMGGDEVAMYEGMYRMYQPYLKADSLGELPDAKGKIKNKVRKDIVKNFKIVYPYYPNAGVYYNKNENLDRASRMFEMYWKIPNLNIFTPKDVEELKQNVPDSAFQVIKYYAVITAIQAGDKNRSQQLIKDLIAEPYVTNSTYKESDPYELLTSEYLSMGDTINYIESLKSGANKFPKNQYFTVNLINQYITSGNKEKALNFLDQAIENSPNDKCLFTSVKGSLFAETKEYETAINLYNEALAADPSCERSLEGLALVYIFQAQDLKESSFQLSRTAQVEADKKTVDLYLKGLPLLEKLYNIQVEKQDSKSNIKKTLQKLQNVYYNLSSLNVDKAKELKDVEDQLEDLKYD